MFLGITDIKVISHQGSEKGGGEQATYQIFSHYHIRKNSKER